MRAIHFDNTLRYMSDAPAPKVDEGEALVRVTMAGICNTDLEIVKGYMGFRGIPGHEFVGVVEKSDDPSWVGKRVVGEINCPCLVCKTCTSGSGNHCPNRTVLGIMGRDGAFADYLTLPQENLHHIPDAIKDEEAVFVEPIAAAFEILEQTVISPTDQVCVVGDGKLALMVAQVLKGKGASLTVIGHHKEKLELLKSWGIHTVLEEDSDHLEPADIVVDCSGSARGFERSRRLLRPRGRLVLKSTFADTDPINLSSLVVDEITLIGSRCGPFAPAITALEMGEVQVSSLITAAYSLEQGIEAFETASESGTLKVLLKMS